MLLKEHFLADRSNASDSHLRHLFDSTHQMKVVCQTWITKHVPSDLSNPNTKIVFDVCKSSLDYLQDDTIVEFGRAFNRELVGKDLSRDSKSRLNSPRNIFYETYIPSDSNITPRMTIFLVVSNIFNRVDKLMEDAIVANKRTDSQAIGVQFFDNVLKRAKSSELAGSTNDNGAKVRVNPLEMLDFAKTFAEYLGIDCSNWKEYVGKIIDAQKDGMELVRQSREKREVAYTLEQATHYRQETIGNYAKLLATIRFESADDKKTFIHRMMSVQIEDDKDDVIEDQWTQVNPFVALLHEFALLDSYIDFCKKYKLSSDRNHLFIFELTHLNKFDNDAYLSRLRSINESYFSLD